MDIVLMWRIIRSRIGRRSIDEDAINAFNKVWYTFFPLTFTAYFEQDENDENYIRLEEYVDIVTLKIQTMPINCRFYFRPAYQMRAVGLSTCYCNKDDDAANQIIEYEKWIY